MHGIDLRRLDLNLLVVFDVLMAERSVTRAAERLSRTQSAVSHALARLREQVGDPLLVRVGGRMVPSPFAETLIEEVRPILRGIERVLRPRGAFDPKTSTRAFRVAVPDVVQPLFARLSAWLLREAPHATLEWVLPAPQTLFAVAEGDVDLLVGPSAEALPEGVLGADAGSFEWGTFLRQGHPALARWSAREWTRWPHVAVRTSTRMVNPLALAAGEIERQRRVAVWLPTFAAVPPLVARSDLIATLPAIVMHGTGGSLGIARVRPPVDIAPLPQRMVWSRKLDGDPALRWLRDALAEALAAVLAEAHEAARNTSGQPRGAGRGRAR
jgi:DNA-binding transcriptional LysR family regulator